MKYWVVYTGALVVAILVTAGLSAQRAAQSPAAATSTVARVAMPTIMLGGNTVRVSIATTPAEQELGLGGRSGLAPDEGMLFVFAHDGDYAFWMKDMKFSIDIVWIDAAGKVIFIAPSVSPDTYPTAFDPHAQARYVLELPAGYMVVHNVHVGDTARL